jgi:E3 ubiquitin-protein ligase HUWE1
LFFPEVTRKNLLFKVLLNLCENAKSRTEFFNLLLNILQDGTGDLAAVDKSFSQLSVRHSKPSSQPSKGKQKMGPDHLPLAQPNLQQPDAVPDLVAHRCLECLTFIVSSNEASSFFFLTEQELPAGLRRPLSKKGKGKEKQTPHMYYPIVLLLGLLDRQSLLKTPSTMESVVGLLATVTKPLVTIKETQKKSDEAPAAPGSQPEPVSQSTPPGTEAPRDAEIVPPSQQTAGPRTPLYS